MSSFGGSFWPRDWTQGSYVSFIGRQILHHYATWEAHQFSSVQSLSHVQLFATPWIAAHQASLPITNSQSSLRLTSIESVMPSSHLILCCPLLLLPTIPLYFFQILLTNWRGFSLAAIFLLRHYRMEINWTFNIVLHCFVSQFQMFTVYFLYF